MKKSFLLIASMFMMLNVSAATPETPYKGVQAASADNVYLYNVASGLWLQSNRLDSEFWTTRAQLDVKVFDVELIEQDGKYVINPKLANNHSINDFNLYMDTAQPTTAWTFTQVETDDETVLYTITSGDYVLGARDKEGRILITNLADLLIEDGNLWQIVTEQERIAHFAQATAESPVDASFLIKDPDFTMKNERHSAWQGIPANNAVAGDNIIHCNALQEMWGLTDADLYQTLTVPNGTYEVCANACYNVTGQGGISLAHMNAYLDGTETVAGYIYANDAQTEMVNFYSIARDSKINYCQKQVGDYWVPAGNGQVSAAFFNGLYEIEPFQVTVTDGTLRLGAKVVEGTGTSWVLVDNFSLKCIAPESVTNAISTIESKSSNGRIYNINGIEVQNAAQHGIYIIDGKKVVR